MAATPSVANVILGGITASFVASHLFAAATSPRGAEDAVASVLTDGGHAHKGDRLPLFHAAGPSVMVAAPSVRLFGAADAENGTTPNLSIALKNVVLVAKATDIDAAAGPNRLDGAAPDLQDLSRKSRPLICKPATKADLASGRPGVRCLA
jgi:hypothetical protein